MKAQKFRYNVVSVDSERWSPLQTPEIIAHVKCEPQCYGGGYINLMDLQVDIQNRVSGVATIGKKPTIKRVIFNPPATIILWSDDTKTVVKCQEGDTYNPETGFALAYLKKLLGNDNTFNKEINKYVGPEKENAPLKPLDLRYAASRRAYDVLFPFIFAKDSKKFTKAEMREAIDRALYHLMDAVGETNE